MTITVTRPESDVVVTTDRSAPVDPFFDTAYFPTLGQLAALDLRVTCLRAAVAGGVR